MEGARGLLVGWGNSTPSQLSVYEKLHRSFGLVPTTVIPDTKRGLLDRRAFGRTLEPIAATLAKEPERPTVVHFFSDNGFIGWAALLDALSKSDAGKRARDSVRGVIMDSSPGLWAARGPVDFARRFALGMTPAVTRAAGFGARERVPGLTPLLGLAFLGYQLAFPRAVENLRGASTIVAREQPRCPHLFLVGEDDILVPPRDIRAWIALQRARGIEVEEQAFPQAKHVALFPRDPRRYRSAVGDFVARVAPRAEGSS